MVGPTLTPGSRHEIPVRRPEFPFDSSIPRHWIAGNPLATHFFNGLNLTFPDGERFFIRAVREHEPRVRDEALLRQVRGFYGQEARHAHEHERYFETLEAQGYRIRGFLRRFRRFIAWSNRWLPASFRLAVTAGAEHYTATLGHLALAGNPLVERAHPTMRALVLWHATEEVEHKAVAFDVLRATHPSYPLRVAGFLYATVALFGWTLAATRMLLRQDGYGFREVRALRRATRREVGRRLERAAARAFLSYLRPGFHPNQVDDLALARRRLAEIGLAGGGAAPA